VETGALGRLSSLAPELINPPIVIPNLSRQAERERDLDGEPIQNESYNPNSTLHSKIFSPNFRGDPHPYLPNNA
jgi:hypothetical protein